MIDNPAYKGEWVHPLIDNPDYVEDNEIYAFQNNKFVGFEIWQVKAGTIFDNIIITDDVKEAESLAELTKATQEGEKKMQQKEEAEKPAATDDEPMEDLEIDPHAGHDHSKTEL